VTGDPENRDVIPNRAWGPASNLFCDSGDASCRTRNSMVFRFGFNRLQGRQKMARAKAED